MARQIAAAEDENELIAAAAPPPARSQAGGEAPSRPMPGAGQDQPRQASAEGFTDFHPAQAPQPTLAAAGNDLIEGLPGRLPVLADLASTADRPFGMMPEIMPPPPLRPMLPPELQDEEPRPGLLARMLGRK